jgi:hypothetical protein
MVEHPARAATMPMPTAPMFVISVITVFVISPASKIAAFE